MSVGGAFTTLHGRAELLQSPSLFNLKEAGAVEGRRCTVLWDPVSLLPIESVVLNFERIGILLESSSLLSVRSFPKPGI